MFGENAALLDISTPPTTQDAYGDATGDGTSIWSGRVPCTLRRRRDLNPFAPPSARVGAAAARADIQTLIETDEVIVRTATGIPTGIVPGGDETGYTLLVEDRRDARNITQRRFVVRSVQMRTGIAAGSSLSFLLADGV
jgi:hypothetical protein